MPNLKPSSGGGEGDVDALYGLFVGVTPLQGVVLANAVKSDLMIGWDLCPVVDGAYTSWVE
jgi:hypothetical protein